MNRSAKNSLPLTLVACFVIALVAACSGDGTGGDSSEAGEVSSDASDDSSATGDQSGADSTVSDDMQGDSGVGSDASGDDTAGGVDAGSDATEDARSDSDAGGDDAGSDGGDVGSDDASSDGGDAGSDDAGGDADDATDLADDVADLADGSAPTTGSISGRVDTGRQKSISGALVTAYRVATDGSLTALLGDGATATTTAEGLYELVIDLADEVENDVIVVAESGELEASVMLSRLLEAASDIDSAPMTIETSIESDTYLDALVNELFSADTHTRSQLRGLITAAVADAIITESDVSAAIGTLAESTIAAMTGFRATFDHEDSETTADQLEDALAALVSAQAELDAALLNAADADAVNAALDIYADATIAGFIDGEVDLQDLVAAMQSQSVAMMRHTVALDEGARNAANAGVAAIEAAALAAATEGWFAVMQSEGAVEAAGMAAVQEATKELVNKVASAGQGAESIQTDIQAAFDTFQSAITTQIDAATGDGFAITRAMSGIRSGMDEGASVLSGVLNALSASAGAIANGRAAADAFAGFYSSVASSANIGALTAAGFASDLASGALLKTMGAMRGTSLNVSSFW